MKKKLYYLRNIIYIAAAFLIILSCGPGGEGFWAVTGEEVADEVEIKPVDPPMNVEFFIKDGETDEIINNATVTYTDAQGTELSSKANGEDRYTIEFPDKDKKIKVNILKNDYLSLRVDVNKDDFQSIIDVDESNNSIIRLNTNNLKISHIENTKIVKAKLPPLNRATHTSILSCGFSYVEVPGFGIPKNVNVQLENMYSFPSEISADLTSLEKGKTYKITSWVAAVAKVYSNYELYAASFTITSKNDYLLAVNKETIPIPEDAFYIEGINDKGISVIVNAEPVGDKITDCGIALERDKGFYSIANRGISFTGTKMELLFNEYNVLEHLNSYNKIFYPYIKTLNGQTYYGKGFKKTRTK